MTIKRCFFYSVHVFVTFVVSFVKHLLNNLSHICPFVFAFYFLSGFRLWCSGLCGYSVFVVLRCWIQLVSCLLHDILKKKTAYSDNAVSGFEMRKSECFYFSLVPTKAAAVICVCLSIGSMLEKRQVKA